MKKGKKVDINLPDSKILCSICGRDIGNERHIRCQRCTLFHLCLECFSVGQFKPPHEISHKILIVEPNEQPVLRENWTTMEENLLLAGIQACGVGNWNEVSLFVRTKSNIECEAHYLQTYIQSPNAPFPIPRVLPPPELPPPPEFDTRPTESCPSEGHEKHLNQKNKKERTLPGEYSGFMPFRHEFEHEYNDEAETLVGPLEFQADDNSVSFEKKIAVLISYNQVLAERRRREKVIEEWGVHEKDVNPALNTDGQKESVDPRYLHGFSPSEKAIDSKLLPIAPFFGHDRTLQLATLIHKQMQLVAHISTRMEWQRQGIKSHHEGQLYNQLHQLIRFGRISPNDVDNWNKAIQAFNLEEKINGTSDDVLLSAPEMELCKKEELDHHFYMGLKNAIEREFVARGRLSKEEALAIAPGNPRKVGAVYDLFKANGWIIG